MAYRPKLESYAGKRLVVGIRPENLEDAALEPDTPEVRDCAESSCSASHSARRSSPTSTVSAPPALTEDVRELARDVGQESAVQQSAADGAQETVMVGRFGPRSRIASGDTIDVAVETSALHFFDLESGFGIYGHESSTDAEGDQA